MNRRKLGAGYEEAAAAYLVTQGYEILCKNYRCRVGEIDLIARDQETLVFVEVKYRASTAVGSAMEAVDERKQKVLVKTALYYLTTQYCSLDVDCRFDVVGIDGEQFTHLKDAFQAGDYY